jgi:hypothetical protein
VKREAEEGGGEEQQAFTCHGGVSWRVRGGRVSGGSF